MRYFMFRRGGYGHGHVGTKGGEVFGKVTLFRDPQLPMEAVTLGYALGLINDIDASIFTSGYLPAKFIPEFKGDITKVEGGVGFALKPTGVVAGTYTKVTVDKKGRIISGGYLTEDDLPIIPFSKLTGTPTTLAGYGINDAISNLGGNLTGKITVPVMGSNQYSLVNKQYIDTLVADEANRTVGSIKRATSQPSGYLLCNGALVSKSTYSALYAKIGDAFTYRGLPGSGRPWEQQHYFNEAAWLSTIQWGAHNGYIPEALEGFQAIVTKDRAFVLGGRNSSGVDRTTIYATTLTSAGNPGSWSTFSTSLPVGMSHFGVLLIGNYLYTFGGKTSNGAISTVYRAPIDGNGNIGNFSVHSSLPAGVTDPEVVVTHRAVYVLGGANASGTAVNTISTASVAANGDIGNWSSAGNLPTAVHGHRVVVTPTRLTVIGGTLSVNSPDNSIQTVALNPSTGLITGSWSRKTGVLPTPVSGGSLIVTRNYAILAGGKRDLTRYNPNIYICPIDEDGNINAFYGIGVVDAQPLAMVNAKPIMTKGKLFWIGGTGTVDDSIRVVNGWNSNGLNNYSVYYNPYVLNNESNLFALPEIANEGSYKFYIKS